MKEHMKKNRILISALAALSMMIAAPPAAKADQSDKLIKILVAKGIITSEEAQSLKEEVAKTENPAADWTKKVDAGYSNGAYIKTIDDRFSLKLNVRTQGQFKYEDQEDQEDTSSFSVRRARLVAGGNAFYPWMKYDTQITLEGGSAALRDASIQATYFDWLQPKLGQYKVPFDREFLTSAFNLQLIDRSIASNAFSLQRDIGLQFSGDFLKNFNYAAGLFNGSGANQSNQDQDFMYVGRIVYAPFGAFPYSQAALDTPDSPKLAVGAAGAYLPDLEPGERKTLAGPLGSTSIVSVTSDVYELAADLALKYQNFSCEGGYFFRNIDPLEPTTHGEESAQGYYLQGGYFLIPKKFELAGRYSWVNPDNPSRIGDNDQQEYTGGLTYYLSGHNVKLQGNYSYFTTETATQDQNEHVVQGQVTLGF